MSKVSQRLDLEDPKTILEFGKKINSLEQLKLLFIFTVVDMKATGKKYGIHGISFYWKNYF